MSDLSGKIQQKGKTTRRDDLDLDNIDKAFTDTLLKPNKTCVHNHDTTAYVNTPQNTTKESNASCIGGKG